MRFYDAILTSKQLVVRHCSAIEPARNSRTLDSEDDDIVSNVVNSSGAHFSSREYKGYQEK